MAFDAEQTTLIHEALGLFQGNTYDWYDYNDRITGAVTSVPIHNQIDFSTAITRLAEIIAAIVAGSDGREARIKEILVDYKCVSTDEVEVGFGGAANAQGLRFSTAKNRARHALLLQTHLGIRVRVIGGPAQGIDGEGGGRNISIVR